MGRFAVRPLDKDNSRPRQQKPRAARSGTTIEENWNRTLGAELGGEVPDLGQ